MNKYKEFSKPKNRPFNKNIPQSQIDQSLTQEEQDKKMQEDIVQFQQKEKNFNPT